ncbi:MAG: TIGR03087 family PEP-CTERM/XrtA system glycosyltransferase [Rhodocyclaceae bacterium]|nr:TIGR03087 family PEP-CTERM/XrtA system glycosyltransferase [Rhodocyclaceae bacterium]
MSRLPLLYLVHRIPYPPNKGDKVRSFNILRHLARHFRVYLGCFVDHPDDLTHVPELAEWCEDTCAVSIRPLLSRLASLRGLLSGEALTVPYYRKTTMARWVRDSVARQSIEHAVVFSGAMAQYLEGLALKRCLIDFCDVDSAKWTQYAQSRRWPMSWLYQREGARLGRFERDWAARADVSTFVTAAERGLFLGQAPHLASRTEVVENGVDADYFAPANAGPSPYPEGVRQVVFSGAMDYWPNVDAACWFANEVMPLLRARLQGLEFTVVGMNPTPAVRALEGLGYVRVTGTVADVRPYVAHGDVVVAPLRVARGIQNKVLEAMSLARPVVVSTASLTGLRATPGEEFLAAGSANEFADAVAVALEPADAARIGAAARARVVADYSWEAHVGALREMLRFDREGAA